MAWLTTQEALDLAIARAVGASQGRLTVQGASGSLLSTVRVARIAWRGDDVDVEADDMALTWSVIGLVTRHVNVSGLGAHRLAITMKGSDAPLALPADLSLPLEVSIANVGVERLEWHVGPRAGTITGVVFDYHGGARTHVVRHLRFVTDVGTLAGDAELAAVAPFALNAALNFTGDGTFRDTRADVSAKGTLAKFAVSATGTSRDAAITADATLTPFAAAPLAAAHIAAKDVDVARFRPALPATRLSVTLDAEAVPDGFAGTLVATNADAGALDAGRVPLAALNSRFRWDGRELALDDIDARLAGDARVTGRVTVPADGAASRWQLGVRDLDLQRVYSTLVATRLNGTLNADVAQGQAIRARRSRASRPVARLCGHDRRPPHRHRTLSRRCRDGRDRRPGPHRGRRGARLRGHRGGDPFRPVALRCLSRRQPDRHDGCARELVADVECGCHHRAGARQSSRGRCGQRQAASGSHRPDRAQRRDQARRRLRFAGDRRRRRHARRPAHLHRRRAQDPGIAQPVRQISGHPGSRNHWRRARGSRHVHERTRRQRARPGHPWQQLAMGQAWHHRHARGVRRRSPPAASRWTRPPTPHAR